MHRVLIGMGAALGVLYLLGRKPPVAPTPALPVGGPIGEPYNEIQHWGWSKDDLPPPPPQPVRFSPGLGLFSRDFNLLTDTAEQGGYAFQETAAASTATASQELQVRWDAGEEYDPTSASVGYAPAMAQLSMLRGSRGTPLATGYSELGRPPDTGTSGYAMAETQYTVRPRHLLDDLFGRGKP